MLICGRRHVCLHFESANVDLRSVMSWLWMSAARLWDETIILWKSNR